MCAREGGAVGIEDGQDGHRVELGVHLPLYGKKCIRICTHGKEFYWRKNPREIPRSRKIPFHAQALLLKYFASSFWTPSKFIFESVWWLKIVYSCLAKGSVKDSQFENPA